MPPSTTTPPPFLSLSLSLSVNSATQHIWDRSQLPLPSHYGAPREGRPVGTTPADTVASPTQWPGLTATPGGGCTGGGRICAHMRKPDL
jgi:hypothetical protein